MAEVWRAHTNGYGTSWKISKVRSFLGGCFVCLGDQFQMYVWRSDCHQLMFIMHILKPGNSCAEVGGDSQKSAKMSPFLYSWKSDVRTCVMFIGYTVLVLSSPPPHTHPTVFAHLGSVFLQRLVIVKFLQTELRPEWRCVAVVAITRVNISLYYQSPINVARIHQIRERTISCFKIKEKKCGIILTFIWIMNDMMVQ